MRRLITIGLMSIALTGCWENEKGTKQGTIIKVANSGMFFRTYDGEFVRGGIQNMANVNRSSFNFSIDKHKPDLIKKVEDAMELADIVVISYHCEAWVAPWRGTYNCLVDDVK